MLSSEYTQKQTSGVSRAYGLVEGWISSGIVQKRERLTAQGKEIPEYMLDMWQDSHAEYVEEMAKLKYKFEMLKS